MEKFLVRHPQLFLLMYSESGFGIEMGLQDIESSVKSNSQYCPHYLVINITTGKGCQLQIHLQ